MKKVLGLSEDGREVADERSLESDEKNDLLFFYDGNIDNPFTGVAIDYNINDSFPEAIVEVKDGFIHGYQASWSNCGQIHVSKYEEGKEIGSLFVDMLDQNTYENLTREEFIEKMKIIDPGSLMIYENLSAKILGCKSKELLENLISTREGKDITSTLSKDISNEEVLIVQKR